MCGDMSDEPVFKMFVIPDSNPLNCDVTLKKRHPVCLSFPVSDF